MQPLIALISSINLISRFVEILQTIFKKHLSFEIKYANINFVANDKYISRCVGMADEADSKSVVGNNVWVQVPPPAVKVVGFTVCRFSDFLLSKSSLFAKDIV